MAIYYANELNVVGGMPMTAGIKARDDIAQILSDHGCVELPVIQSVKAGGGLVTRALRMVRSPRDWAGAFEALSAGDTLVVQLPLRNHSKAAAREISNLPGRGVKVIALIHDLERFRYGRADKVSRHAKLLMAEEESIVRSCYATIVHNESMAEYMVGAFEGVSKKRLISLGCFDYLVGGDSEAGKYASQDGPVIIAGNLSREKAGYAYELPTDCSFALYGVNYNSNRRFNVDYRGAHPSDELPSILEGSFGLVWDGPSAATCAGTYGEYLRINNPHKASLYLASGIPVIIWHEAAMAKFIQEHQVGMTVGSLDQLSQTRKSVDEQHYTIMKEQAVILSRQLRNGCNTWHAIECCC